MSAGTLSFGAETADTLLSEATYTLRPEDAALVAALQAGSEEAFTQLIAQYSGPLYSLMYRSLSDPTEAADVVQEIFLKVFRSVSGFHGGSSLKTWVYRIAMHEASNRRRWFGRHRRAEVAMDAELPGADEDTGMTLAETLASSGISPLQELERGEMHALVEDCLGAVPAPFRSVVVLRELEGMAYEEIAEILDIPCGTVRSRLLRGRAALHSVLCERLHIAVAAKPQRTARRAAPEAR